jgi:hypothetical protein
MSSGSRDARSRVDPPTRPRILLPAAPAASCGAMLVANLPLPPLPTARAPGFTGSSKKDRRGWGAASMMTRERMMPACIPLHALIPTSPLFLSVFRLVKNQKNLGAFSSEDTPVSVRLSSSSALMVSYVRQPQPLTDRPCSFHTYACQTASAWPPHPQHMA